MTTLKTIFKTAVILFLIGVFLLSCAAVVVIACAASRDRTRRALTGITSKLSGTGLRFLGVRIRAAGTPAQGERNALFVCNHLSYLDILVISSLVPALFITSIEVKRMFFLGAMAQMGGSLFVERRKKSLLPGEISMIADTLRSGFAVVLFPEGTSSNGDAVLPFKKTLMRGALQAGKDIIPACIRYTAVNGGPVTPANRDRLYYYGDIQFFPHFMNLFRLDSVDVSLRFLDPVRARRELSSDDASRAAYEAIRTAYSAPAAGGHP